MNKDEIIGKLYCAIEALQAENKRLHTQIEEMKKPQQAEQ